MGKLEAQAIENMSNKDIYGKATVIQNLYDEVQRDKYCKYNKHGVLMSYSTGLVFIKYQGEIKLTLSIYEPYGSMFKDTCRDGMLVIYGHEEIVMVDMGDYSVKHQHTR